MSDLFLGKIRQIDAAIKDTNEHITCLEQTASKHREEVEEYRKEREKVLKAQEFCNCVLVQVNKALVMLDELDPAQVLVFKNAIDSQFKPDAREPLAEDDFTTFDKPQTLPPIDKEDAVFTDIVPQLQFKAIREQFARLGIQLGECYINNPETKCWYITWGYDVTKLVLRNPCNWEVESTELEDELPGKWRNFDLHEMLQSRGINLDKLIEVRLFEPRIYSKVVSWKESIPFDKREK